MDNEQLKEKIRKYWEDGNIGAILQLGFESFLTMIFDRPLKFDTFLDYTGSFFDGFIRETCEQEPLKYVGGKFRMELGASDEVQLNADFYFQDHTQQWILKQKSGQISSTRFKDWKTSVDLMILQNRGQLELPIDPPKELG